MTDRIRIALAQINPTAGDLEGNAAIIRTAFDAAKTAGADILLTPEMSLAGYQLGDLGRRPAFVRDCMAAAKTLAAITAEGGPALLFGAPYSEDDVFYNAMYLAENGVIRTRFLKHRLPNDGVFDELRFYTPADAPGPIMVHGLRVGVPICEDAWHPEPVETLEESGAEILLVPNGSPYERGKHDRRVHEMVSRVVESGLPLIYLNLCSGQDDQVFDGGSFVLNTGGALAVQAPFFQEALIVTDWTRGDDGWRCEEQALAPIPDDVEADYAAMVMALRDYTRKTGFSKVVLGMSGGIDSALVATIAADALGPENVWCLMLASEYTSDHSLEDAAACALRIGAPYVELPIKGGVAAISDGLSPFFEGTAPGIAEENVQSRLRGLYLMALSNKFGHMLLTTGNKSEVAVGYATLYGDMSGGYNPIKDLYKTRVFETARWRNANHRPWMKGPADAVIPGRIIEKPPSAELRADQKDSDSLPEYDILDGILERLVDGDQSIEEIVAAGYDRATVQKVERLVFISEYKRFQAAPGAKLTHRAFWLDRRYPMVNRWRDRS